MNTQVLTSHYIDVRARLGLAVKTPVIPPRRFGRGAEWLYAFDKYEKPIGPQRVIYREVYIGLDAVRRSQSAAQNVIADIATQNGLSFRDVVSRSRVKKHVMVRAVIAHRLRSLGLSLPQIGRVMGGRDHTSILYLCQAYTPEGEKVSG